uniref:Glutaredoxin-2, mitochondrial n=2 Tax=Macrostomum lignano TaxID=282301 RepID=A0A1I8HKS4_9PLAT
TKFLCSQKIATMASGDTRNWIEEKIASNKVMMFSKSSCPFCTMAKKALDSCGIAYTVEEIEKRKDCSNIQDTLCSMTKSRTVPQVFINGKYIGGGTETKALADQGKLKALVNG